MDKKREWLSHRLPDFCTLIFVLAVTVGAFTGGFWAALGLVGASIAMLSVWWIDKKFPLPDLSYAALVFFTLSIAAILNFWSWQPQASWAMWLQLMSIFLPLLFFTNVRIQNHLISPRLFIVLPYAACAGSLLLGAELVMHGPLLHYIRPSAGLYQYNRGLSYLVILAFPILAALWMSKRRLLAVFFVMVLLLPASYTESRSAKLAFILALLVTVAAHFFPRLTLRSMIIIPIVSLLWPFAIPRFFLEHHNIVEQLPPSWQDRVEIWDYMSYRILERPLNGWGLGGSRGLSPTEPHGSLYHYALGPAPHPHNAVLQLWIELGIAGLILGIAFALFTLYRAGRLNPALAPFAAGAWAAAFSLSMMAYNFWSDSLWAAFALTGLAFSLLQKQLKAAKLAG